MNEPSTGKEASESTRRVLAAAVREIDIRKSGFERFVATTAERASVLYGLVAVVLSVGFGWAAGALWRRF